MALPRATHDDTINIAAGIYAENNLEVSKRLRLQSAGNGSTIINGHFAARSMRVNYTATLADFALRNGRLVNGSSFEDGCRALLIGNMSQSLVVQRQAVTSKQRLAHSRHIPKQVGQHRSDPQSRYHDPGIHHSPIFVLKL